MQPLTGRPFGTSCPRGTLAGRRHAREAVSFSTLPVATQ